MTLGAGDASAADADERTEQHLSSEWQWCEIIAPKLSGHVEPFDNRLHKSEEAPNEKLGEIMNEQGKRIVRKGLINLEQLVINDKADVDSLVKSIRSELMQPLDAGVKIRIV